ncbi:hypothetical protein FACS189476_11300 [Spirochaetia bacterium]|nr:hypothetical protein FACS189476_11300 [Spirochaetia bacterium]
MKNNKKWNKVFQAGMAALVLAFGLVLAGCPTEPTSVTGVTLDETAISLTVGQSKQLTATVAPSDADDNTVAWESSSESVATVSDTGLVSAVSAGTTTIKVTTTDGGKTAECTVTVTTPAPTGNSRATAIPLTDGTLMPGSVTAGGEKWYSFTAAAGTNYNVSWEDSAQQALGSSYTADVYVSAYAGTSTTALSGFSMADSGYTTPKTISGQSGTIYLKVMRYAASTGSTFAIKYTTAASVAGDSRANPITLTADTWAQGDLLTASSVVWYKITVPAATTYYVWGDDRDSYNVGLTGDIAVTGYIGSASTAAFSEDIGDSSTNHAISVSGGGDVYLRVVPYNNSSTRIGTYAIVCATISQKPASSYLATALTSGAWGSNICATSQSYRWHSYSVTGSTTYTLTLDGAMPITALYAYVYSTDGTQLNTGSTYLTSTSTTQTFTPPSNGTVYIKIIPVTGYGATNGYSIKITP